MARRGISTAAVAVLVVVAALWPSAASLAADPHRLVAWEKTWTTSATRTISLVAAGPSSRPRIDLEAFAYVK